MDVSAHIWILLLLPLLAAAVSLVLRRAELVLGFCCVVVLIEAALGYGTAWRVLTQGRVIVCGGWFFLDALSALHLAVMATVFALSSLYALGYFRDEIRAGTLPRKLARRFSALWLCSLAAMTLVLISNNIGILWVGIEASTLLTAFLICIHRTPASLEAMWKYLIICSVGVAFAFMGTLFVGAATRALHLPSSEALLWTNLARDAARLDPVLMQTGFLFLLVGYGTKAGLAPMHTWLPDAHSQAPAPVSALFSGFMLNCSLYCILRYVPLVEIACGHSGWSQNLLVFFGMLSILVAAGFIIFQRDVKRMLAYSSVEHIGIIALGAGLGGLGAFAALFHTVNHSLCKSLAFFSAGRIGQARGSNEISRLAGTLHTEPAWGKGLFVSLLALIGLAPFALFMSEFLTAKAAADTHSFWTLALFLGGLGVVFISVLRPAISMAWSPANPEVKPSRASVLDFVLVLLPLIALLMLGLWMPEFLRRALEQGALIIGGRG